MSNINNKKLEPKLRFPDFAKDEEWKLNKLGNVYSFITTNSFSRDDLNYINGEVKNIHYGDIHTKFSTLFDITKENVPFINESIPLDKFKQENYCKERDIIFADASEDLKDVGKSIEVVNLNNEKLLSGLHTLLARQINYELVVGFGCYLFLNDSIRKQIQRESQGAKVLGISATRLSNINIFFPEKTKEQQKIASCLSSLDVIISAESQKLNILQDHKKGLLQNLFPQEGDTIPKLRFKEFEDSGEWEVRPLGEIAYKIVEKNKNGIVSDVFTNSAVQGIISQRDYFEKDIANQNNLEGYYIVNLNDFVYNPRKSIAAPFGPISRNKIGIGAMSPLYFVFRFKSGDFDFIEHFFKTGYWHKHMQIIGNKGARDDRMSFSKDDFYDMPILFPNITEQQKIASCLSSLDDLINTQNQKIEALKLHKKGLLQGLFPNMNNEV